MPAPSISNHFALTALQEGVSLTGSLRVAGALSQNYNVVTHNAIPDWKNTPSARPTIYPVVRKGASYIPNSAFSSRHWYYNEVEILFDANGRSTNYLDSANDPLFQSGTITVELAGVNYVLPALTVIGNLASDSNLDLDTIAFRGSTELVAGSTIAFEASVDVKISQMTTQGYLGQVTPESAIISQPGQNVQLTAALYGEDGAVINTNLFWVKWFNAATNTEISSIRNNKTPTVYENSDDGTPSVVDNLVLRCDFFSDSGYINRIATAFVSVDDTQDPEFLYISFNNGSSDYSGQVSPGETVTINAWVATMDDPTAINAGYTTFVLTLYDGQQEAIPSSASGYPTVTVTDHKAAFQIPYDFIAAHGDKISGCIDAT